MRIPEILLALLVLLAYGGSIIAVLVIVLAVWRGMKAQERTAVILERIERILREKPGA